MEYVISGAVVTTLSAGYPNAPLDLFIDLSGALHFTPEHVGLFRRGQKEEYEARIIISGYSIA